VKRLIYFSRDYTTHDHRFLASLAESQYETYYLRLEQGKKQLEDRSLPPGINKIHWSGGESSFSYRAALQRTAELRKLVRRINPDLIHAGPIHSCAFLTALTGFQPLISMSWGYDLLQDAERSRALRKITQFTLRRSRRLITDCQTVSTKATQLGMAQDRIISFPWGVDLERFSPGKYPPEDMTSFTILSTRSWEPIYGVDILARGFVKASQVENTLRMIMLGNGSLAPLLREIFDRGGVSDKVYLPGQVSQLDLPRYYQMADLYVSASHTDGSSVSLMEALACGRPVLVSDIAGNREWVEPDINGWWFTDGDVDEIAEKILMAVELRQELSVMSSAARQIAEERADWTKNFPVLLDAYDSVLTGT